MSDSYVIFIGGRSGVGKSTVAFALHDLLIERDIKHALIEGDLLDLAHPAPWNDQLAERNLAALWSNYRELGYRRLIYTNTVSILEVPALTTAMGCAPIVTAVLLRSSDSTAAQRLERRERGASLERHIVRSARSATHLDQHASNNVYRIDTDGQPPAALAAHVLELSGWSTDD